MQIVKRAALTPVEPSSADRAIYTLATRRELQAHADVRKENAEKSSETKKNAPLPSEEEGLSSVEEEQSLAVAKEEQVLSSDEVIARNSLMESYKADEASAPSTALAALGGFQVVA